MTDCDSAAPISLKGGDHAQVEHVVWSERDHCHYFYLVQPGKKLSRGYRADELADPTVTT